jgi:hypothetical protein
MVAAALRNFASAPVRAATLSGGVLSFMAYNRAHWLSASVQTGAKDLAKILAKNSAMARQASLM